MSSQVCFDIMRRGIKAYACVRHLSHALGDRSKKGCPGLRAEGTSLFVEAGLPPAVLSRTTPRFSVVLALFRNWTYAQNIKLLRNYTMDNMAKTPNLPFFGQTAIIQ